MKKQYLTLVYTIFCFLAYSPLCAGNDPIIFSGSMRFPASIKTPPDVRFFWSGHSISCTKDKKNKMLHFSIPGLRHQRSLYLVVAKDICFKTENNVIYYLYLTKEAAYKFYYLELCGSKWIVKELCLLKDATGNLRLPDDAILVYYDPRLIAGLEGGNAFDLPTITVLPNILSVIGSERLLHDASDSIVCSALAMNAIHCELQQDVRPSFDNPKTIVTITT